MDKQPFVRLASQCDSTGIVDLSVRVQAALTASGSLQQLGPLPLQVVETSIHGKHAYILDASDRLVGSVLVDPLDGICPNTKYILHASWGLEKVPSPLWYLHALMLEPAEQGKGLGLVFWEGVVRAMKDQKGTVVLDCWAGNSKLREFYQKAGFMYHGDFPENDYCISVYFYALNPR
jgi:GNAT superfamily N-acetyltransferase